MLITSADLDLHAGVLIDMCKRTSIILDYDGYFLANGYAAHFAKIALNWKL